MGILSSASDVSRVSLSILLAATAAGSTGTRASVATLTLAIYNRANNVKYNTLKVRKSNVERSRMGVCASY